jgi:hypothetical protein
MTLNEYTKKDGTTGASVEVRVNDLTLLGKRDDSIPRDDMPPISEHSAAKANAYVPEDEDIAF